MSTSILEDDAPPTVPEWFVTFADMMSLLLAFFIMLLSMSSLKEPKQFQNLVAMLQEQFGHNPARGELETNLVTPAESDKLPDAKANGDTRPGGTIYFGELDTALTDENKRDLVQIVRQLHESNDTIEIRGHAAKITIDPKSGVRDLWDLADRRCHAVLDFVVEQGVDSSRIRLANSGTTEPAYNGSDVKRLRENSRVEVRLERSQLEGF